MQVGACTSCRYQIAAAPAVAYPPCSVAPNRCPKQGVWDEPAWWLWLALSVWVCAGVECSGAWLGDGQG